jgi:hypothetical protein
LSWGGSMASPPSSRPPAVPPCTRRPAAGLDAAALSRRPGTARGGLGGWGEEQGRARWERKGRQQAGVLQHLLLLQRRSWQGVVELRGAAAQSSALGALRERLWRWRASGEWCEGESGAGGGFL